MQGIGRRRICIEDAWRAELPGRGLAFNGLVGLKEKVIIIEPAPCQPLITARGTGRDSNDMQVSPKANRVPRRCKRLGGSAPAVAGVSTKCHPAWLLKREPDSNGARLRAAQHRACK